MRKCKARKVRCINKYQKKLFPDSSPLAHARNSSFPKAIFPPHDTRLTRTRRKKEAGELYWQTKTPELIDQKKKRNPKVSKKTKMEVKISNSKKLKVVAYWDEFETANHFKSFLLPKFEPNSLHKPRIRFLVFFLSPTQSFESSEERHKNGGGENEERKHDFKRRKKNANTFFYILLFFSDILTTRNGEARQYR